MTTNQVSANQANETTSSGPTDVVHKLIQQNFESEKNFFNAAEQVENRAVKLLLKAYAQERAKFARQLQQTSNNGSLSSATAPSPDRDDAASQSTSSGFLHRGWVSLAAALVVQRQRRQHALITELLSSETDVINAYDRALSNNQIGESLHQLLQAQSDQIHTVYEHLSAMLEESKQRLVLRLFDENQSAEQAIQRLHEHISATDRVIKIPIDAVPVYYNDEEERGRSTREAVVTGGLLGVLFGALLGGIYGIYHWAALSDVLPGFLASSAAGVIWELALYGAVIGCLFSVIFSSLITRNTEEIDEYLYEQGLQEGDVLVAVFADEGEASMIRRTIGLKHEHEIEPVPA